MCSRELWLLAAVQGFDLTVVHKPGADLTLADALSRAHCSAQAQATAQQMCRTLGLMRVRIRHSASHFTTNL